MFSQSSIMFNAKLCEWAPYFKFGEKQSWEIPTSFMRLKANGGSTHSPLVSLERRKWCRGSKGSCICHKERAISALPGAAALIESWNESKCHKSPPICREWKSPLRVLGGALGVCLTRSVKCGWSASQIRLNNVHSSKTSQKIDWYGARKGPGSSPLGEIPW